jgi:hypothetical protein
LTRFIRISIVAFGLCALPTIAGADTFMLIQGVAGDVTDPAHKNWIRVSGFDWGVEMPVTTVRSDGGGATVGRAAGDKIKLTIPTGAWSRDFLNNVPRGIAFSQVVIDHINPDGRPAYRISLGNFVLTHYRNVPNSKSPAQDELEGVIGSYKAEFYAVGTDGRVTSTTTGWNFVTNTGSP